MNKANALNRNANASIQCAANAGCLSLRAAFARAESTPAMRMRMHAEQADAVAAAL
ncbi:MAG: hypothetical protein VB061_14035 [Christensenella sp.]|nr:hypothetical protein [Christensenella sp.]